MRCGAFALKPLALCQLQLCKSVEHGAFNDTTLHGRERIKICAANQLKRPGLNDTHGLLCSGQLIQRPT